jgi:phage I-like protein
MSEKSTTDRRSFLKLAGLGTAGVVVTAAGTKTVSAEEIRAEGSLGYSETEHVKKVYKLARF